ncbi:MAG: hypothetical protein U1F25_11885 [Rubrivivax sp.]
MNLLRDPISALRSSPYESTAAVLETDLGPPATVPLHLVGAT